MKAKQVMVSAAVAGALVAPMAAQAQPEGGLSLDKPVVMGERVAVKHVTKKVSAQYQPPVKVDLDEYAKQLSSEKLAVKKTTKKIAAQHSLDVA